MSRQVTSGPRLRLVAGPADPAGVVLLLHGGQDHGTGPVRPTQLAVMRMVPIARRVVEVGRGRLAVVRLQDRVKGWNDDGHSPVADARWAIATLRERFGDVPVSLIGHSMGGRVVMRVADAPGVVSVVGLAPWLPDGESVTATTGRRVLIVHGGSDHTTDPKESQQFIEAARSVALSASFVMVRGVWHPMLRRRHLIEGLASEFSAATIMDEPTRSTRERTGNSPDANLVRQVLSGAGPLVI